MKHLRPTAIAGFELISSSSECETPSTCDFYRALLLLAERALHAALQELTPGCVPQSSESWLPADITSELRESHALLLRARLLKVAK